MKTQPVVVVVGFSIKEFEISTLRIIYRRGFYVQQMDYNANGNKILYIYIYIYISKP